VEINPRTGKPYEDTLVEFDPRTGKPYEDSFNFVDRATEFVRGTLPGTAGNIFSMADKTLGFATAGALEIPKAVTTGSWNQGLTDMQDKIFGQINTNEEIQGQSMFRQPETAEGQVASGVATTAVAAKAGMAGMVTFAPMSFITNVKAALDKNVPRGQAVASALAQTGADIGGLLLPQLRGANLKTIAGAGGINALLGEVADNISQAIIENPDAAKALYPSLARDADNPEAIKRRVTELLAGGMAQVVGAGQQRKRQAAQDERLRIQQEETKLKAQQAEAERVAKERAMYEPNIADDMMLQQPEGVTTKAGQLNLLWRGVPDDVGDGNFVNPKLQESYDKDLAAASNVPTYRDLELVPAEGLPNKYTGPMTLEERIRSNLELQPHEQWSAEPQLTQHSNPETLRNNDPYPYEGAIPFEKAPLELGGEAPRPFEYQGGVDYDQRRLSADDPQRMLQESALRSSQPPIEPPPNLTHTPQVVNQQRGQTGGSPYPLGGVGKKQGGAVNFGIADYLGGKALEAYDNVSKRVKAGGAALTNELRGASRDYIQQLKAFNKATKGPTGMDHIVAEKTWADERAKIDDAAKQGMVYPDVPDSIFGHFIALGGSQLSTITNFRNIGVVTRWVADNIKRADQYRQDLIGEWVEGTKGVEMRGPTGPLSVVRKISTEKGLNSILRPLKGKLFEEWGEIQLARDIALTKGEALPDWESFRGKYSDAAINAAKGIDTLTRKIAEAVGIKPQDGFFPHMWMGNYALWIKDNKTNQLVLYKFDTQGDALRAKKEFEAAHKRGEGDYTVSVQNTSLKMFNADLLDPNLWFQYARGAKENEAIRSIMDRASKANKFKTHLEWRKGVGGYVGSKEPTPLARAEAMQHAYEAYLNKAAGFLAKKEFLNKYNELTKDRKFANEHPNEMQIAQDFVENRYGNPITFDKSEASMLRNLGGGATYQRMTQGVRHLNQFLVSVKLLGNVLFAAGNYFQAELFGGSTLAMNAQQRGKSMFSSKYALLQAYKDWFTWTRDPEVKEIIQKAGHERSLIDPALINDITLEGHWITGEGWKRHPIKESLNAVSKTNKFLSEISEERARVIATLMSSRFEQSMSGKKIKDFTDMDWDAVAKHTERIMNDYTRSSQPMMYNQAGIAGEFLRPFKSFLHQYVGTLKDLTLHAMEGGFHDPSKIGPLVEFVAMQGLFAGLVGEILINDSDNIIKFINWLKTFDVFVGKGRLDATPIKPLSLAILESENIPDWLKFGVPSSLTGKWVGGSVMAPNLIETASGLPIGIQSIMDTNKAVGDKLSSPSDRTPELLAGRTWLPNWLYSTTMEFNPRYASKDPASGGVMVPSPYKDLEGQWPVSPSETKSTESSRAWGVKGLDEFAYQSKSRHLKQYDESRKKIKQSLINSIAQSFMYGEPVSQEDLRTFGELGGEAKDIKNKIEELKRGKITTPSERAVMGNRTRSKKLTGRDLVEAEMFDDVARKRKAIRQETGK
jgi:hypothetical protein